MAHECIFCGTDCYCNGYIDDTHVMKNNHCTGCGCELDEWDGVYDPESGAFECLLCGNQQDHEGECEMCSSYSLTPTTD